MRASIRRGIAPLELVISLPIVMLVTATVFALTWALMHKTDVAVQARHQAWLKRSAAHAVDSGSPDRALSLQGPATGGQISTQVDSPPFSLPSWLGGSATACSGNVLLSGSWDYRQVDFHGTLPHLGLLATMTTASLPAGIDASAARELTAAFVR
jgi:hypothetical protein